MDSKNGKRLRGELTQNGIFPFIGIYDAFSASIAAKHFSGIFLSGFGFAAGYYGLPDIGFITWNDMVSFVQRVRAILPNHHILVDMDDGYGDHEIAAHVTGVLEAAGASGIVMEDQKRPRRCGHLDGKQLLELDQYLLKLDRVLQSRKNMVVIARTDAVQPDDIYKRTQAFAAAGADAVLVDGIGDLDFVRTLSQHLDTPLAFNQIAGGKSPAYSLSELEDAGISIVIYSTPCLFPVQGTIEDAMVRLKTNGGILTKDRENPVDLKKCVTLLNGNQSRRT
jgi:2-methylisocitrate lyase-like PEP mutase family enzyme